MYNFVQKMKNFTRKNVKNVVAGMLGLSLLGNSAVSLSFPNNVFEVPPAVTIPETVTPIQDFYGSNVKVQYVSDYGEQFEATAYSPDEGWDITASGIPLTQVIGYGVASNDFPLMSWIHIECPSAPWISGDYQVVDRMAYDGCIDIAMGSSNECYDFGRRTIYVTFLG